MDTSAKGIDVLIQREGFRNKAYQDSVGVWTIGVGHTAAAGPPRPKRGMAVSDQEVRDILTHDLVQYEDAVERAIGGKMRQCEFDAMVSLCFNIGTGAFAKSSVVRKYKAGDKAGAADAFLMWKKPIELLPRRRAERAQFLGNPPVARIGA